MQQALDMWSGMIPATRGALIPEKTFWYAIDFLWHKGTLEYTPQDDLLSNNKMIYSSRCTQMGERLELTQDWRTLGFHQCPTGTNAQEIEYLTKVA